MSVPSYLMGPHSFRVRDFAAEPTPCVRSKHLGVKGVGSRGLGLRDFKAVMGPLMAQEAENTDPHMGLSQHGFQGLVWGLHRPQDSKA